MPIQYSQGGAFRTGTRHGLPPRDRARSGRARSFLFLVLLVRFFATRGRGARSSTLRQSLIGPAAVSGASAWPAVPPAGYATEPDRAGRVLYRAFFLGGASRRPASEERSRLRLSSSAERDSTARPDLGCAAADPIPVSQRRVHPLHLVAAEPDRARRDFGSVRLAHLPCRTADRRPGGNGGGRASIEPGLPAHGPSTDSGPRTPRVGEVFFFV